MTVPTDKEEMVALFNKLEVAQKMLEVDEAVLRKLEMKSGQDCATIHICGQAFEVTSLGRETGYMPKPSGFEYLRLDAIRAIKERLTFRRGAVEGAKHAIGKFVKEVTK